MRQSSYTTSIWKTIGTEKEDSVKTYFKLFQCVKEGHQPTFKQKYQ